MRTASSTQALGTRQAIRAVESSTIPSALSAIKNAGLKSERIDETSYRVADEYTFFPATGYWRHADGHGYTAQTLIRHTRRSPVIKPISFVQESSAVTERAGIFPDMNNSEDPDRHVSVAVGEHTTPALPANPL